MESKRICVICGYPLSRYNESGSCFHHSIHPEVDVGKSVAIRNSRRDNQAKLVVVKLQEYGPYRYNW